MPYFYAFFISELSRKFVEMEAQNDNDWKKLNKALTDAGDNLNILEEEVDIEVQKAYFRLAERLSEKEGAFRRLGKMYANRTNDLFDESMDPEEKKKMLVVLSTIDNIAIYRALEKFSKTDSPLKKWAVIALQQSRMLIQSGLLEDPGIFISTGLGGQGSLLRYFCVFIHRSDEPLPEFQRHIVQNETESALKPLNGQIEQIHFYNGYSTLLLLLPIHTNLKELFEGIISESNQYGHFLLENLIITNVKKLTGEEIDGILKKKRPDPSTT